MVSVLFRMKNPKVSLWPVFPYRFQTVKKVFKNNILNKLPKKDNDTLIDFDSIADRALIRNADNKLAAIKLDIDNLGTVLMNKEKTDYKKLSGGFDIFFSKTLYEEILKPH